MPPATELATDPVSGMFLKSRRLVAVGGSAQGGGLTYRQTGARPRSLCEVCQRADLNGGRSVVDGLP